MNWHISLTMVTLSLRFGKDRFESGTGQDAFEF